MATSQKISIEGVEYAVSDLSDEAKKQLLNLRATDQELARLQTQVAIAQTARVAYSRALAAALSKANGAEDTNAASKKTAKKASADKA